MYKPKSREAEHIINDGDDVGRVESLHDDQTIKQ